MRLTGVNKLGNGNYVSLDINEQDFADLIRKNRLIVNITEIGVQVEVRLGSDVTYDRMFIQLERFVREICPEKAHGQ